MKEPLIQMFPNKAKENGRFCGCYFADAGPEGLTAAAFAALAGAEEEGPGPSYLCSRLLEKIEADGLALCGLRFDQVSASFEGWISGALSELAALKDEGLIPSVPSFTAVLTVQNSCICIGRDGPRCLLLSEKILRDVTPAGSVSICDLVIPGTAVLLLIPRDAEALLPYPFIREKLEDGRQQALSDLYKRSLRAGAAGGPMITISLSGPGGPDGSA